MDYRRIVFDLKDQVFKDRPADNRRYVSVCDIWGVDADSDRLLQQIPPDHRPAFPAGAGGRCKRIQYPS